MFAHERHTKILKLLARQRRMEVQGLPEALGVSPATLRRDLTFLEQHDRVVRVHGGNNGAFGFHGQRGLLAESGFVPDL